MGDLLNSFRVTNLDLEDSGPLGRIIRSVPLPAYVPPTSTGTPTSTANPGPFSSFYQKYIPSSTYLSIVGKGSLTSSTNKTNLDVEDPGVNGGIPYKQDKDPTVYPATNTGTPTSKANPGAPSKFNQIYTPNNTYLSAVGDGQLASSVDKTNFDVENAGVNGGIPYKQDKDPTVYPARVSGTPTTSGPGAPVKFNQVYLPSNEYLNVSGKGKLINTTANTNLDVENEKPNGGIPYKQDKDPTVYPARYVSGTPTTLANPGAPVKFNQIYNPGNVYLDKTPIKGEGKLKSTVKITNLDVEDPGVDGGIPYKTDKDPTVYPLTTQKKSSTGGFYPIEGKAADKFNQVFNPKNTYLDFIKEYT